MPDNSYTCKRLTTMAEMILAHAAVQFLHTFDAFVYFDLLPNIPAITLQYCTWQPIMFPKSLAKAVVGAEKIFVLTGSLCGRRGLRGRLPDAGRPAADPCIACHRAGESC